MLEDTAADVCALAYAAWATDDVRKTAALMCGGDRQAFFRSLLSLEIAKRHLAQRDSLRLQHKEIGHCCP